MAPASPEEKDALTTGTRPVGRDQVRWAVSTEPPQIKK